MGKTDVPAAQAMPEAAGPENPFGKAGQQIRVESPVDFGHLHAAMNAALPDADVHAALRHPSGQGPAAPDNPAYLSWIPAALTPSTVRELLQAHDPSPDMTTNIGGTQVAQRLRDLREQMSEGKVLGVEDLTSAVALLVEALAPPTPS